MRSVDCCLILALGGCSNLFGLQQVEPPSDDDDEIIVDAFVGPDASTAGWPTYGGVPPRDCAGLTGADALDEDLDDVANGCDNCPLDYNKGQEDQDADGIGDVCDPHVTFAVERLAYFSTFEGTLAEEGAKVGSSGTYVTEGGLLRQSSATTVVRTLFVIAGGPWRKPVVELKIAGATLNGTNADYYAGIYILQDDNPSVAEPRPDSLLCNNRYGSKPRYRIARIRDNVEVERSAANLTVGTGEATLMCASGRLGERPGVASVGTDVSPNDLMNWMTISNEPSDFESSRIGLWTYHARADFAGIAIYETIYP